MCFMGIILSNDKSSQHVIKKMGLHGIPVINLSSNCPNCVNYYNDVDYICYLIKFIHKNYGKMKDIIKYSVKNYISGNEPKKNVLVMAEHKRPHIFETNIKILKTHKDIHALVFSVSDPNDISVCKKTDVNYCITRNQLLGEKWQHALIFAKLEKS